MHYNPKITWWEDLLDQPWYRGSDVLGRGMDKLFMGEGFYLSWDKEVAYLHAALASDANRSPAVLTIYLLNSGLKFLDFQSKEMKKIKKKIEINAFARAESPVYQKLIIQLIKEAGYDGVINDRRIFGVLLFNPDNATPVDREYMGYYKKGKPKN